MEIAVADAHETIAAGRPDAECLVYRERRLTWIELTARTRRLANALHTAGLGCHQERIELSGHQSGQDHLAIYLRSSNEYLEAMLGAFKARVAPFNVNYRYVAAELLHLLTDADASCLVIHSEFTPVLAEIRDRLPNGGDNLRMVMQVADDSGLALAPGAQWYEDVLAASSAEPPPVQPSPDDLYLLYTGGTTGLPKGVMWRNGDARVACFGGAEDSALDQRQSPGANATRVLIAPPLMHGAGHWVAFRTWWLGGTVFLPWHNEHLEPDAILRQIDQEKINLLLIVGDAFARPLADRMEAGLAAGDYDLSSLTVVLSGGAPLSVGLKERLHALLPTALVIDGLGSSESGGHMVQVSAGGQATSGIFPLTPGNHILSADRTAVMDGPLGAAAEPGWLARTGRMALGYLGDPHKTAATYPVIDGVRYVVPGDRATPIDDASFVLHGRDSVTINTGGEKVFAEEVEAALRHHDGVYDCVVAGRPSQRWGQEVVAVVQWRDDLAVDVDGLLAVAAQHISRYKLPKAVIVVDRVVRSPAGKADYRWAAQLVRANPGISV